MKVGLALAGGGMQALAYIGAIQALNEEGIKIDYISGTSSGSILATLYALGFSTQEMKDLVNEYYKDFTKIDKKNLTKLIRDYIIRKKISVEGLIDGGKIEDLINKMITNDKKISDVDMPLAIATVDTISTKECIFLSKRFEMKDENVDYIYDIPLAKAIRASMAFPGIFTTCNFDKYNFIDGGTKDNLPVKVLKDMGADFVIGISFDISGYNPSDNIMNVILRAVDIFSQKDVVNAQKISDIAIEIDNKKTSLLETENIDECIEIGYCTMKKYCKQIKETIAKG